MATSSIRVVTCDMAACGRVSTGEEEIADNFGNVSVVFKQTVKRSGGGKDLCNTCANLLIEFISRPCRCTSNSEDRGGGHFEDVVEPDDFCPLHGLASVGATVIEDLDRVIAKPALNPAF